MRKPGEVLADQPCYKEYRKLKYDYFAKYPEGRIQSRSCQDFENPDYSEHRSPWVYLLIDDEWVYDEKMTQLCWERQAWLNEGLCGGIECQTSVIYGRFWCDPCGIQRIKEMMKDMKRFRDDKNT